MENGKRHAHLEAKENRPVDPILDSAANRT